MSEFWEQTPLKWEQTVYYVPESPSVGKIVAIAPVPLRPDDRDESWSSMRITAAEWEMLMEKDTHANWFVALDPINNMHTLKARLRPTQIGVTNLNQLMEALPDVNDPELILEHRNGFVVLHDPKSLPMSGILDLWLTPEQNQTIVLAWVRIEMKELDLYDDRTVELFPIRDVPTTIYYSGRVQRIKDARAT